MRADFMTSSLDRYLERQALDGLDLAAYLSQIGWVPEQVIENRYAQWTPDPEDDRSDSILVPLRTDLADAERLLHAGVHLIANLQGLDIDDVTVRVAHTRLEVIEAKSIVETPPDGSINVEDGIALLTGAIASLRSSATFEASSGIRAYFAGRQPDTSTEFMSHIRLGQTQVGSYVIPLLTKLEPIPVSEGELDIQVVPFERRVTTRLLTSVRSAATAAEQVAQGQGTVAELFGLTVADGVTANLCKALVEMLPTHGPQGVGVAIGWSHLVPTPRAGAGGPVIVPVNLREILRDAWAYLVPKEMDRESFTATGIVITLDRGIDDNDGSIVIQSIFDGSSRMVYVDLPSNLYETAIHAHENRTPVAVTGTLVMHGRRRHIENVTMFFDASTPFPEFDDV